MILLALLIVGCSPVSQRTQNGGFRDTSVAISSSTRFDPQKFAGEWNRLAAFGGPYVEDDCGRINFVPNAPGQMTVESCAGAKRAEGQGVLYKVAPYGRLEADGASPIWVLWVTEDFGTAVLGTPSGAFGWILNRGTEIRLDRYAAATELLDFNGYDLTRLKRH
jgi:apolipoprotein D and lipocalin family protein